MTGLAARLSSQRGLTTVKVDEYLNNHVIPSYTLSLSTTTCAPPISVTPTSLTFGVTQVATTSTSQRSAVQNSSTGTLTIGSVAVTGDYLQTHTCSSPLPPARRVRLSAVPPRGKRYTYRGTLRLRTTRRQSPHGTTHGHWYCPPDAHQPRFARCPACEHDEPCPDDHAIQRRRGAAGHQRDCACGCKSGRVHAESHLRCFACGWSELHCEHNFQAHRERQSHSNPGGDP